MITCTSYYKFTKKSQIVNNNVDNVKNTTEFGTGMTIGQLTIISTGLYL